MKRPWIVEVAMYSGGWLMYAKTARRVTEADARDLMRALQSVDPEGKYRVRNVRRKAP